MGCCEKPYDACSRRELKEPANKKSAQRSLMQPRSPRSRRRRRRRQVEREATFSKRQTTFGVGGGSDDDDVELEAERGKREQVGNLPCRVAAAENRGLPFLEDFRTDPEKRSWWICRSPIAAFRRGRSPRRAATVTWRARGTFRTGPASRGGGGGGGGGVASKPA